VPAYFSSSWLMSKKLAENLLLVGGVTVHEMDLILGHGVNERRNGSPRHGEDPRGIDHEGGS